MPTDSTTLDAPALDRLLGGGYERKVCFEGKLEIKAGADGGPGQIKGYASTFANWDRNGERPVKGAFTQDLADFIRDGVIMVNHKVFGDLPVASITECYEDSVGLFVVADFHSTEDAQAARTVASERLARAKSVMFSIGYMVLEDEYVPEGRLLKRVKLFEISLVNIPANPSAQATGVKSVEGLLGSLTLEKHSAAVRAAVEEYILRVKGIQDLRMEKKEGRVLSAATVGRLTDLKSALTDAGSGIKGACDSIDEVLAMANPKADESKKEADASEVETLALRVRMKKASLDLQAAQHGITIN